MMLWIMVLMVVRMVTPPLTPPRKRGGESMRVVVRADLKALATIAGGAEGAYILARVMEWTTSNERRASMRHYKEGAWWLWYSYAQWSEREVPWLSADQVGRIVRKLEADGLLIGKQFEMGGCKWYRPNMAVIGARIREVSPDNVVQMRNTPVQNRTTPMQERNTPVRKQHTTIFESNSFKPNNKSKELGYGSDNTLSSTQADSDHEKKSLNERADLFRRFGRDGAEYGLRKAQERNADNPVAYAAKVCRNEGFANPLMRSMRKRVQPLSSQQTPPLTPPRQRRVKPLTEEAKAWEAAYGQLELQLDSANFDTWVRGVEFDRVDGDVWVLRARNESARNMLQHRLCRNVRRVLADVVGAEVEVQFVIESEVQNVRAV